MYSIVSSATTSYSSSGTSVSQSRAKRTVDKRRASELFNCPGATHILDFSHVAERIWHIGDVVLGREVPNLYADGRSNCINSNVTNQQSWSPIYGLRCQAVDGAAPDRCGQPCSAGAARFLDQPDLDHRDAGVGQAGGLLVVNLARCRGARAQRWRITSALRGPSRIGEAVHGLSDAAYPFRHARSPDPRLYLCQSPSIRIDAEPELLRLQSFSRAA
jgi:hypothetical protein